MPFWISGFVKFNVRHNCLRLEAEVVADVGVFVAAAAVAIVVANSLFICNILQMPKHPLDTL